MVSLCFFTSPRENSFSALHGVNIRRCLCVGVKTERFSAQILFSLKKKKEEEKD
jgi:hypothetical protein